MKRIFIFSTLVLFLSSIPVHAGKIIASEISAVTLYSDQALVQREAVVDVEAGINTLQILVNAFAIDTPSATAKVYGDGSIVSVQVATVPMPEPPQEKIQEIENRIKNLNKEKQALLDKKASVIRQEKFLNSVSDFSDTQIPKDIETQMLDPEALIATFELLGDRFHEVYRKKTELDRDTESLEEDIRVARRMLDDLRQPGENRQQVIEIVFDAEKRQQVRIFADYVAYNAYWSPVYRVTVPEDLAGVSVTMNAQITQKTGEDWPEVSLSISNAIPLKGVRLPELSTWWLDLQRPQPREQATRAGGKKMFDSVMMAAPEAEIAKKAKISSAAASYAEARKKESGIAFEYQLSQPVSVASRQKETLLPIYNKSLAGEFYYYCVPRINPRVYLVCEVAPDREMLAGPMHIYFSGQYTGKTEFSPTPGDNSMLLALGADRAVTVDRKKMADHVKETFFGKFERDMVVRELGYRTTIENRKEKSIQIRVLDQIPVAKTDKINVDDVSFEPLPDEKDYLDQTGVMLWKLKLGPQKSAGIDTRFTVAYPKDQPPLGL